MKVYLLMWFNDYETSYEPLRAYSTAAKAQAYIDAQSVEEQENYRIEPMEVDRG